MIVIINEDAVRFSRNGQLFDKNFRARAVSNDQIMLVHILTDKDTWKTSHFDQYEIDGVVYGTQLETINALMAVTYSGVGGAVTISTEDGKPTGAYNPIQTMSYNRVMGSNVDLSRSTNAGFTGSTITELFEDQYTTMINETGDAIKTIKIEFKNSVQSILAVLQAATGDFSNVKAYITFSNGFERLIIDESADNTKKQSLVLTAPDVIGANGLKLEFVTVDDVSLSSIFIPQLNLTNSLIEAIDTITGDLQNITSTNGLLNVFTKEKEYESPENKWGQNDDVDTGTTPETIWDGSDLYTYTDPATPVTYAASSDNAADTVEIIAELITLEPGTGNYIEELVPLVLNGQNKVVFAPPSGNLVIACNRAFNNNGVELVGDVYIYESAAVISGGIPTVATLIRSIITVEAQQTRQTAYVVPDIDSDGNVIIECHIIKWSGSVVKTNTIVADLYFMVQEPDKIMRAQDIGSTKNGIPTGYVWGDKAPLKKPTKSRIEIRCVNISANDGSIVGKYQLQKVTENEAS